MGSQFWLMGLSIWLCIFFSYSFISVHSQDAPGNETVEGTVFIDPKAVIGKIDDDFICATLDWWPPEKCDYGRCSWDHASLLNLNLNNNILLNAIKAFSPLKLRLGGTLQDKLIYNTEDNKQPCIPFAKNTSEMFGFTQGCLPMNRWDELNTLFKKSGAKIIFGLNALNGRTIRSDGSSVGAWNYTNAESFIRYTVEKNYSIHAWELGNELCGSGVGTRVAADQYASDTISLQHIVQQIYKGVESKPLIISPGGFFEENWFKEFIQKTTQNLDVVTRHIYNLGPGVDEHLVEKILDPSVLDNEVHPFSSLQSILKNSTTSAVAWVGEAGGAYNSGHNHVSNAFVYSFWYLDQLGMAAAHDTKTYCRQTLIGGNYGLLNTVTFVPNPDYYSALLWHQLMGRQVLSTSFSGTKKIRCYTHCSKSSRGFTLLLINLDNQTTVQAEVAFNGTWTLQQGHLRSKHLGQNRRSHRTKHLRHKHRSDSNATITRMPRRYRAANIREEYHLTAKDGNLHSQTMLLNGNSLNVDSSGNIPPLEPVHVNSSKPIMIAPLSIVFVHVPNFVLPACE